MEQGLAPDWVSGVSIGAINEELERCHQSVIRACVIFA